MERKEKTAFSYLRVSGKSQVQGDGFRRQRQAVQDYARSNKIEIAGEFRDEGVSGTREHADRPGLATLMERLAENSVRLVLVKRSDRLARDLIVGELLLAELRRMDAAVVSCDSGADLTDENGDPSKKLIRQVLPAVSEFEKSVLVRKLRAARERIGRKTGRCEGPKPFGCRPGEARTLERIRELNRRRGGKRPSAQKIADVLQAEGLSTRSGRPWNRSTVRLLLKRLRLPRD